MKLKLKKKNLFIICLVIILLIAGGSLLFTKILDNSESNNQANSSNNKVEDNDNNQNEYVEPEVQIVNVNSKTRPYAVMIDNEGKAKNYHSGLQDAYLVYELIVEGNVSRYMALFKDQQTERFGPIRSARHYFLDYVLENDAIYVHHGWSSQAKADILKLGINRIEVSDQTKVATAWRENINAFSWQNLFTSIEMVNKGLGSLRTNLNNGLLLNYSALNIDTSSLNDVTSASKVNLKYANSNITNYIYDENANVYKQYLNNKEHIDYKTGEQYTVKNIITYQVKNNTIAGDDKNRQEIDNIGSGNGYYITNGVAIPITWEKESRSAKTVYKYKDGTEITVNDGNTWIHIVPTSGKISIS